MHSFDKVRQIWGQAFGCVPSAVGTFDHMTSGLHNRIAPGYLRLMQMADDPARAMRPENAVSVVFDTVIPAKEVPCGVSFELGVVPDEVVKTVDPGKFFFCNEFVFLFDTLAKVPRPLSKRDREEMKNAQQEGREAHVKCEETLRDALDRILGARERRLRAIMVEVVAMRLFKALNILYENRAKQPLTCADMLARRGALMAAFGVPKFPGKQVLYSELLPATAQILEVLLQEGIKLEECPGTEEIGVARYVSAEGREDGVVKNERPDWDLILEHMRKKRVIPTTPLILLTLVIAPGYLHFGNDYGHLDRIGEWLRMEPNILAGDGQNSWPVGRIKRAPGAGNTARTFLNALVDLMHFPWEIYGEHVRNSAAGDGRPRFDRTFSDFMVI